MTRFVKKYTLIICFALSLLCTASCESSNTKHSNVNSIDFYISEVRKGMDSKNADTVIRMAENYFRFAPENAPAPERDEMATCLKWALIKNKLLCYNFLSYSDIREMQFMFPYHVPLKNMNYPLVKIFIETGMYLPASSILVCAMDKHGVDSTSAQIYIEICIAMGRNELGRRYLSYVPEEKRGEWEKKLEAGTEVIPSWDGLPYLLTPEPHSIDGWYTLHYPKTEREREVLRLDTNQQRSWLDYYTLEQLLYKNLDDLDFIISEYKRLQAKRLPNYVEEAILLKLNYMHPDGPIREEIEEMNFEGFSISSGVLNVFEPWYMCFLQVQRGLMSPWNVRQQFGSTYLYYYVWDGISHANTTQE